MPTDIATRFEGALGEELREPEPAPEEPEAVEPEVWADVKRRSRRDNRDDEHIVDVEVEHDEEPDHDEPDDGHDDGHDEDHDERDDGEEREPGDLDVAAIVPGQSRAGGRENGAGLAVSPKTSAKRPRRVVVAEPRTREILVVPRRRSRIKDVVGTLVLALVLLVGAGGVAFYLEDNGIADFGLFDRGGSGALGSGPLTVRADDGWVSVPAEPGAVLISADGTYRIRLDGEVFTGSADQRLRVPIAEGTDLSVRSVRAPTAVTVTRTE
ncbi:hypothetical protein [Acuticoccus sediminis]|nr:hypothetical protein [Acuticoccus sediminis]